MNQLKVSLQEAIVGLFERGWSQRRIARDLRVDRETVKRYISAAKPAISTTGSTSEATTEPAISTAGSATGTLVDPAISTTGSKAAKEVKPAIPTAGSPAGRVSLCREFLPQIIAALGAGLSAQRIHQDLVSDYGFAGSYESVKRCVRSLSAQMQLPVRRMESAPGEQMQVDFGQGAWVVDEAGKRRRPHLFRAVLSHSRKGYSEVVWRQDTETFIRCVENAFRHFGGVTRTTVVDNLKAAVLEVDWFDPELNPKMRDFAQHYGTVVLPTQPARPEHKGKIEAGVKYVQNNALKGRSFPSLGAQNTHLADWERSVADTRIHGTVRQQVGALFALERPALQALPDSLFPSFVEARRKVHRDGHIEFDRAYYSVPPEYFGREVWVRAEARMVRVFNLRMEVITAHARVEPGRFATADAHKVDDLAEFEPTQIGAMRTKPIDQESFDVARVVLDGLWCKAAFNAQVVAILADDALRRRARRTFGRRRHACGTQNYEQPAERLRSTVVRVMLSILHELIDDPLVEFSEIAAPPFEPSVERTKRIDVLSDRVCGVTLFAKQSHVALDMREKGAVVQQPDGPGWNEWSIHPHSIPGAGAAAKRLPDSAELNGPSSLTR